MVVPLTRDAASRGKNVLIVCCGVDLSKCSIFRQVRAHLDVNFFCLEHSTNRMAIQLESEGIWRHVTCDDINELHPSSPEYIDTIIESIKAFLKNSDIGNFDGATTIWDDAVGLAARIAEKLELPGNSVQSVDIAHDKYLTRQCLAMAGLPCPLNILISENDNSDDAILDRAKVLKMPVIVKPASAGSSIGVRKVDTAAELVNEYHVCLEIIKHALDDGELMGINMGQGKATDVLVEEFLKGDEVDVDVVLHDGKVLYAQVMDDWPFRQPWFCELGCHFPSKHPKELRDQFIAAATSVVNAIGLTTSVHHIEFINDANKGPTLVEANPRMGGGPVYNFHRGAYGIDLFEEVLFCCLGLMDLPRASSYPGEGPDNSLANCVTKVAHARKSGIIKSNVYLALQSARDDPDVILAAAMSCQGDHVTGWGDGFPTDMARIDVVSSTLSIDECIQKADRHLDSFFALLEIE